MSALHRAEAEARARELGHDLDRWIEEDTGAGHVARILCRRCPCALFEADGVPRGTALLCSCAEVRRSISRSPADLE